MVLVVLCSQSTVLNVSAEEGESPKLRDEKPQLREDKPSLELRDDGEAAPGLREDDGDIDVGGAGRDTTCPLPSDTAATEKDEAPLSAEEQYYTDEEEQFFQEEVRMERKTSFKEIKEIEEEEYYRVEEDFDVLVHNATVLSDPECQYWLGRAFERGAVNDQGAKLLEADANQAAQLYMMAAKSGHGEAARTLGVLFELHSNPDKAAEWYMKGIELGNVGAAGRLGGLYEEAGRGEEAVQLYQEAAALGDAEAQADMGRLYETGLHGVEKSIAKALDMYTLAAQQGDSTAMMALGTLYEHGNGVPQSYEEAAQWYLRGAKGGDPFACMHIARCYKRGIGIEQNLDEAEKWAEVAVGLGLDGSEVLEEREREEMNSLGVPLKAGRPSRYTYLPICDRALSKEEKEARDAMGFDGVDTFDNQKVRYKRASTQDYLQMHGVLFPIKPASAA